MPIVFEHQAPAAVVGGAALAAGQAQYNNQQIEIMRQQAAQQAEQSQRERMQQAGFDQQRQRDVFEFQNQQQFKDEALQAEQDREQRALENKKAYDEYAYTTQQKRDLEKIQNARHDVSMNNDLGPEEKAYAMEQLAYMEANVKPMPKVKPHEQGSFTYNEDKGTVEIRNPNGTFEVRPYDKPGVVYGSEIDHDTRAVWGLDKNGKRIRQLAPGPKPGKPELDDKIIESIIHDVKIAHTKDASENVIMTYDTPEKQEAEIEHRVNLLRKHRTPGTSPAPFDQAAADEEATLIKEAQRAQDAQRTPAPREQAQIPSNEMNAQAAPAQPAQAAPQAPAGPVRVNSPQDVLALPPGTQYVTPEGRIMRRK